MKRFISRITFFTLIPYASICLGLFFFQERLLFAPVPLAEDHAFKVKGVEEVFIDVLGARISALHFKNENPKGLIFFLHGNSGNLDNWLTSTSFYERSNFDLFMIDYRGYGKSTGRIESEEQLKNDVRIAWDSVAPEYEGKAKIIYGRSLGTALASDLSVEIQPDMTILVSPYYSMSEMAQLYYPWVPGLILRYSMNTSQDLPKINNPIYIFHGDKDQLIPIEHSIRLSKLSKQAHMIRVKGALHDDIHHFREYEENLIYILSRNF